MTTTPPPPPPPAPGSVPDGPAGSAAGDTRPWWKRKRVIIPAVIVALIVLAGIAGGGTDDDTATATATTDDTGAESTEPETSEPADEDDVEDTTTTQATTTTTEPPTGIGAIQGTGSGGLARVNAVTANAAPLNEFTSPSPGTTFTRLDVEVCAGEDGQTTNPLYWNAGLDDNTDATATLGAQGYQTVDIAQGECQRGSVDVEVPDGRAVASVYLTSAGLSEIARWNLAEPATGIPGPLTPTEPPERTPLGQTATTPAGPATAHTITDGVAPDQFVTVPAGHTLTRLDVEVCAGDEARTTNPLYWYGLTAQNRWLSAELGAQNFETGEIAPGQCRRGTVDVAVPDGDTVTGVALVNPGLGQDAAWSR